MRRKDEIISSRLYQDLKALVDAKKTLQELGRYYRIIALTSRLAELKSPTKRWLKNNFGEVVEELHHTGFYDSDPTNGLYRTKAEQVKALGAKYFIDDQVKHVNAAAKLGVQALLFGDYHYQVNQKLHPKVVRVKNWREASRHLVR